MLLLTPSESFPYSHHCTHSRIRALTWSHCLVRTLRRSAWACARFCAGGRQRQRRARWQARPRCALSHRSVAHVSRVNPAMSHIGTGTHIVTHALIWPDCLVQNSEEVPMGRGQRFKPRSDVHQVHANGAGVFTPKSRAALASGKRSNPGATPTIRK